jgi:hypothetical protein
MKAHGVVDSGDGLTLGVGASDTMVKIAWSEPPTIGKGALSSSSTGT